MLFWPCFAEPMHSSQNSSLEWSLSSSLLKLLPSTVLLLASFCLLEQASPEQNKKGILAPSILYLLLCCHSGEEDFFYCYQVSIDGTALAGISEFLPVEIVTLPSFICMLFCVSRVGFELSLHNKRVESCPGLFFFFWPFFFFLLVCVFYGNSKLSKGIFHHWTMYLSIIYSKPAHHILLYELSCVCFAACDGCCHDFLRSSGNWLRSRSFTYHVSSFDLLAWAFSWFNLQLYLS